MKRYLITLTISLQMHDIQRRLRVLLPTSRSPKLPTSKRNKEIRPEMRGSKNPHIALYHPSLNQGFQ